MKHYAPPNDLLSEATMRVRAALDEATAQSTCGPVRTSLPKLARIFWAGVAASRNLGASDVIAEDFLALATECGLVAELGAATVAHLIHWGLLDRYPFTGKRP
jgi:hypothetical protein